jgi:hypothetical protein
LGKISKEQRAGVFNVRATSLINPNFTEYTKNCGIFRLQVLDQNLLAAAMKLLIEQ